MEDERPVFLARHKLTSNGRQSQRRNGLVRADQFVNTQAIQEVTAGFGDWERHQQSGKPNRATGKGKGAGQHILAQRDGTETDGTDMAAPYVTFKAGDERGTRIIPRSGYYDGSESRFTL